MKKRRARLLALMLACTMTVLPVSNVMAATAYDASGAEVSQTLFPGDSMTGISVPVMQGDTPVEMADGTWTNDTDQQVYHAQTSEDGMIRLEAAGYTLKVIHGTAKQKDAEEEKEKGHHYQYTDEDRPEVPTDLAFYAAGDKVVLTADEPAEGMEFAGWSVEDGNLTLEDASAASIVIEMPEGGITIAAQYREKQPEQYTVTVNNGTDVTGTGQYAAGSIVEIAAADRSGEDLEFTGWSVDTGNVTLADAGAAATSFTMPEGAVSVTANYQQKATEPATEAPAEPLEEEAPKYELRVEYGTSSGEYAEGDQITITAEDRSAEGMQFAGWFVESMNVQLDTNIETTANFTMPAQDVIIAATYEDAPPATEAEQSETTAPATEAEQSETTAPATEAEQSETTAPATEAEQSETTAPVTEAEQSETTAPATEAEQSETTVPATEAEQSETTAPATEAEQSENAAPSAEAEQNETAAPATEATQSENASPIVLPGGQETNPAQTEPAAQPQLYTVTVENGAGSGQYAAGDVVTIEAAEQSGKVFIGWASENTAVTFTDASAQITSFVMPESEVKVRADYAAAQFELVLDDGSGSPVTGTKDQGAVVSITAADRQAQNLEFDHWTGTAVIAGVETDLVFEDAEAADTSFVMPGGSVKVTAVYTEMMTLHHVTVANGTINGSQTEIDCEDGAVITVTADPSEAGQAFSYWEANDGTVDLGDQAYSSQMTVTVNQDMDLKAIYEGIEYNVTVNSGISNYETCTLGTKVTIRADEAPEGMEFDSWYVDSGNASLADAESSRTTFRMPEGDVTITAKYRKVRYQVSVENGKSDAQYYYAGDQVTISSDYPAGGREFGEWKAVSGNVSFADKTRWKTTFTMPASNVVVKAAYKDGPSANDNQIQDLADGGEYYIDSSIKFTAVGAGMTNLTPNPGDYRYRPASYQIANVTGTWQGSPYTTTMTIKATGEYTLKVIFNKDVFDGNAWVSDGTVDTKSVTFRIVTKAAGVATGDTTPIALVAAVMAVSCVIFIILLIMFLRKRKK